MILFPPLSVKQVYSHPQAQSVLPFPCGLSTSPGRLAHAALTYVKERGYCAKFSVPTVPGHSPSREAGQQARIWNQPSSKRGQTEGFVFVFCFFFWDNFKLTNVIQRAPIHPSSNFLYLATYITVRYLFTLNPVSTIYCWLCEFSLHRSDRKTYRKRMKLIRPHRFNQIAQYLLENQENVGASKKCSG